MKPPTGPIAELAAATREIINVLRNATDAEDGFYWRCLDIAAEHVRKALYEAEKASVEDEEDKSS